MNTEPRDRALQSLYEADLVGATPSVSGLSGKARRIVEGVTEHRDSLDETLEAVSHSWRLARMAAVDRTILRMGLYELRYSPKVPTAVVVSESVRLAKAYSTERSGTFVNGVLGNLARTERSAP